MSKRADLIQVYNDEKREYEYFVKGFDVTESIRVLLKAHKEAYDKERRVFTECKAYCDAEKQFKERIADLEAKLAESEEINKLVNKQLQDMEKSKLAWENKYFKLEKQLAEKDEEYQKLLNSIKIKDLSNINFIQVNEDIIRFSEDGVHYEYNKKENTICKIIDQAHQHEDKGE